MLKLLDYSFFCTKKEFVGREKNEVLELFLHCKSGLQNAAPSKMDFTFNTGLLTLGKALKVHNFLLNHFHAR